MKKQRVFYYMSWMIGLGCIFNSCQKDNFAPPKTKLTGHIVYKGTPIQVKNNTAGTVYFELWQSGFGKSGAIDVYLNQDGSFSSLLFNGEYRLVIPPAQGPFISLENSETHSDTIPLTLNGDKQMDIEVLPYYMFNKANFSISPDSVVTANFDIDKIINDSRGKDIESVNLYLNRTSFVDEDNNIASGAIGGGDLTDLSNITLTTKVPKDISGGNIGVADQNYFYVRASVKIVGVDDRLFTDVVKVELK